MDANADLACKIDIEAVSDADVQGDGTASVDDHVDDPDDNAGDADASGDGSAFVDEPFIEYGEDLEADATLETSQKSEKVIEDEYIDKLTWDDYVWVYISSLVVGLSIFYRMGSCATHCMSPKASSINLLLEILSIAPFARARTNLRQIQGL